MFSSAKPLLVMLLLLLGAACSQPMIRSDQSTGSVPPPLSEAPGDRSVLAGEWEYEDGAVVMLRLDEQGNGPYAWKDGRFETQVLDGRFWQGMWFQKENDREGGFAVELSADLSEGEGRWWYTRIGTDQAPTQKGGSFHLTKKSRVADSSQMPPAP